MKGTINILVLGKEAVGKTAVVVRFLTGRYLTEYAQSDEVTYERNILLDGKHVSIKITDVGGRSLEKKSSSKDCLQKVDGAVVVYSVTDRQSFDVAERVVDWLRKDRKSSNLVPIVLLGNKSDLDHSRKVSNQKPEDLDWRNDCYLVTECSASSDQDEIKKVFHMLIKKVIEKRDSHVRLQRKLSQTPLGSPKLIRAQLRRRFSVFTRERTSTM